MIKGASSTLAKTHGSFISWSGDIKDDVITLINILTRITGKEN
jgi:hypothetical protein